MENLQSVSDRFGSISAEPVSGDYLQFLTRNRSSVWVVLCVCVCVCVCVHVCVCVCVRVRVYQDDKHIFLALKKIRNDMFIQNVFVFCFFGVKCDFYAHQGYIYLIKNMWNIITI